MKRSFKKGKDFLQNKFASSNSGSAAQDDANAGAAGAAGAAAGAAAGVNNGYANGMCVLEREISDYAQKHQVRAKCKMHFYFYELPMIENGLHAFDKIKNPYKKR